MTSRDPGLPTRSLSYGWFAAIVIAYLAATEFAKRWFFRAHGPTPA